MKSINLLFLLHLIGSLALKGQSIRELSEQIIDANPRLDMLRTEYQAALERVAQVGQLPDPEIGIGVFPLPVETRLGAQQLRLSATQMFPWFGTLRQRETLEGAKAAALYERIDVQAVQLIYQAEEAYFELYELRRSQAIHQQDIDILHSLEQLALAKVRNGTATTADVLRVQLKLEELVQALAILHTAEAGPLATINQLRNQPMNTVFEIQDSLSFAVLPFTKDSIKNRIASYHPVMQMLRKEQDIAREALALNTINGRPTFGIGMDYINVGERENAVIANNGRDIIQLRATVKVPIFREQYAAKVREENLRLKALDQRKEVFVNQYIAQAEQALAQHETARLQWELYQRQIHITEAAIRILRDSYSTDGRAFDELLQLESDRVNYKRKALSAVVQSHLAVSLLRQYIALPIAIGG